MRCVWLLVILVGCAPSRPGVTDDDDAGDDDDDTGDDDDATFGDAVERCEPGGDPGAWWLTGWSVDGGRLAASLEIGGGCEVHDFALCWDGSFMESWPVQVALGLRHRGLPDPCDAIVFQEHVWDLAPLAEAYEASYGQTGGTIVINLSDGSQAWTF